MKLERYPEEAEQYRTKLEEGMSLVMSCIQETLLPYMQEVDGDELEMEGDDFSVIIKLN